MADTTGDLLDIKRAGIYFTSAICGFGSLVADKLHVTEIKTGATFGASTSIGRAQDFSAVLGDTFLASPPKPVTFAAAAKVYLAGYQGDTTSRSTSYLDPNRVPFLSCVEQL